MKVTIEIQQGGSSNNISLRERQGKYHPRNILRLVPGGHHQGRTRHQGHGRHAGCHYQGRATTKAERLCMDIVKGGITIQFTQWLRRRKFTTNFTTKGVSTTKAGLTIKAGVTTKAGGSPCRSGGQHRFEVTSRGSPLRQGHQRRGVATKVGRQRRGITTKGRSPSLRPRTGDHQGRVSYQQDGGHHQGRRVTTSVDHHIKAEWSPPKRNPREVYNGIYIALKISTPNKWKYQQLHLEPNRTEPQKWNNWNRGTVEPFQKWTENRRTEPFHHDTGNVNKHW